jgi:hypothetical protein
MSLFDLSLNLTITVNRNRFTNLYGVQVSKEQKAFFPHLLIAVFRKSGLEQSLGC